MLRASFRRVLLMLLASPCANWGLCLGDGLKKLSDENADQAPPDVPTPSA